MEAPLLQAVTYRKSEVTLPHVCVRAHALRHDRRHYAVPLVVHLRRDHGHGVHGYTSPFTW